MFEVEKDVAMPIKAASKCLYPWDDMEVGDSFFVPADDSGRKNSVQSIAYTAGKLRKRKFTTRRVEGGIRIWRTE